MKRKIRNAFTLVEVTMAIGIGAFCWLAILALLPVGLSSHHTAVEQTAASNILSALVSDLAATRPGATSTIYHLPIPQPGATPTTTSLYFDSSGQSITSAAKARHRLTLVLTPPPLNSRSAIIASARISWPATAAPDVALGTVDANFATASAR